MTHHTNNLADQGGTECRTRAHPRQSRGLFLGRGFAAILSLVCTQQALALDPSRAIAQCVQQAWTTERGALASDSISDIIQTEEGYLWLATPEGLIRFDGIHFSVFDDRNVEAMGNRRTTALCRDGEENLWIGAFGELTRLKDGSFRTWTAKDGMSGDVVMSLCSDRRGNIWIGTYGGGLLRLKDDRFTVFSTGSGLPSSTVTAVCEDRAGNLWIGTSHGLVRLTDGIFTTYTKKDGLCDERVRAIYEDRNGDLWIGTRDGLNQLREGKFTTYTTEDGLSDAFVRAIYEDRERNLWVGTDHGGLNRRFQSGKFASYTTKDGFHDDHVNAIYEDREGSLWIGTEGGLVRLRSGNVVSYTAREGLSSDKVSAVYEDRQGSLWIGTLGSGLNQFRDGLFTGFRTGDGLAPDIVRSICEDREGNLWIGRELGGLGRLRNGVFRTYGTKEGLAENPVMSILEDREGRLWIGTYLGGLSVFRDGTFTTYTDKDGLPDNRVMVLYEDREGNLWIGTYGGGLARLREGTFTTITSEEGFLGKNVVSIYEDSEKSLWIGTEGGGLTRLRDGKFSKCTRKQGLPDDAIYQMLEDRSGNLWMTCGYGIFHISTKELNSLADGKIQSITPVSYGKDDGMRSSDCVGAVQPAGWRSRDGRLWFPTDGGLVMIDPRKPKTNPVPPPVVIEEVLVDDRPLDHRRPVNLQPGTRVIEIRYAALSFVASRSIEFKYKLEGVDDDWVHAGVHRRAFYHDISPGKHTFRVIACNSDGVWNETGALFDFYLKPYFWQTRTFLIACVLAMGSLVIGLHRLRIRRLVAREKELALHVDEAFARVKILSGMLPICASCKKIRDDKGYWNRIEEYIRDHSEAEFSHGVCPDCMEKLYPGVRIQSAANRVALTK